MTNEKFLLTNDKQCGIFAGIGGRNMKNKNKSINFTLGILSVLTVIFVFLLFSAPWAFAAFSDFAGYGERKLHALIFVFYACSPSAAVTVVYLFKFLFAAKKHEVFTKNTVKIVSVISWACFSAVPLSIPLCFYLYGAFPIPMAAFFAGLLLRVFKNVIKEGVRFKEENELTI